MRILCLRLFVSWWMIPLIWSIMFIIGYLVFGGKETKAACKSLTNTFWFGELEL
jgi:hypothetical protein